MLIIFKIDVIETTIKTWALICAFVVFDGRTKVQTLHIQSVASVSSAIDCKIPYYDTLPY